jgi:hypothetical protein
MSRNRSINRSGRAPRLTLIVTCCVLLSISGQAADWPNPLCVNLTSKDVSFGQNDRYRWLLRACRSDWPVASLH